MRKRDSISGGMLMQSPDRIDEPGDFPATWKLACGEPPTKRRCRDLAFAWRACRAVKSNAILLAKGRAAVGIGMEPGQPGRLGAARAVLRAGEERLLGRWPPPDAFFPFPDGLERSRWVPGSRRSCSPAVRCVTKRSSPQPERRA